MLDAGCWILDVWVRVLGIGLLIPEKFYPVSSIQNPASRKKFSTTVLPFHLNPINACKCEA